jgi:hypothetical protein
MAQFQSSSFLSCSLFEGEKEEKGRDYSLSLLAHRSHDQHSAGPFDVYACRHTVVILDGRTFF